MLKMKTKKESNKEKDLLNLILWDLGLVIPKDKDSNYHLKLAKGNLKDLIQTIERGETWKKQKKKQ
jgi:hypothetical protein